jgi:ketosteroid isomerase-like protein
MAMKMSFPILLVIVGYMGGSHASTVDDSISAVRAQRAESNAAIAAHDAVRLRKLFDDDYHAILGSTGNIDSGGDAATRGYADEEFKDQSFVTYRRTPTSIVIAASGKRIAETGRFEGVWRKPDGTMRRTGVYLAMWIPSAGSWRLKSEAFVTLGCIGSAACDRTG